MDLVGNPVRFRVPFRDVIDASDSVRAEARGLTRVSERFWRNSSDDSIDNGKREDKDEI